MDYERAVVVVPAHNEASNLPDCLKAVVTASACVPFPVLIVVVLDASDDDSRGLAGRFGSDVHFVEVEVHNVGAARRAGFEYAQRICAQQLTDGTRTWYATTDADSLVDADWLVRQTESDADVVFGVVRIANWRRFSAVGARRYLAAYRSKRRADGHGHVHGANMGFRADAYWRVGGFASLGQFERTSTWCAASRRQAAASTATTSSPSSRRLAKSAERQGDSPTHLRTKLPRVRRGTV